MLYQAEKRDFQIDTKLLEDAITEHTKGNYFKTANNPSGVVLTEECIKEVCAVLEKKQKEYGKEIFLLQDEPYRGTGLFGCKSSVSYELL